MSYRGKVILCGEPGVGKTSLLARYTDGKFSNDYHQTIGANFLIKEIDLSRLIDKLNIKNREIQKDVTNKGFKLYFWDLGGQHDKLFSNEYYFIQAVGAMIIFSLNNKETFKNIEFWIDKLTKLSGDIPYIIVGNKSDLNRDIDSDTINTKIKKLKAQYFETSAKLNKNVETVFESLSIQILNRLK
jgi:small GTP-binding protein